MSTSQQFFGSQNRNLSVRWASISCTEALSSGEPKPIISNVARGPKACWFLLRKIIISEINSFIGRTNLQPTCLLVHTWRKAREALSSLTFFMLALLRAVIYSLESQRKKPMSLTSAISDAWKIHDVFLVFNLKSSRVKKL